jgi:parallel beta-helix repeat protein
MSNFAAWDNTKPAANQTQDDAFSSIRDNNDALEVVLGVDFKGGRESVYNVTTYGATVDGSTNDLTAINNAGAAANTAGGGIVQFGEGNHYIEGSITIYDNVVYEGAGYGSRVTQGTAATDIFSGSAKTKFIIRGIRLYGEGSSTSEDGVLLTTCTDGLIEGCWFDNIKGNGVKVSGGSRNEILDNRFSPISAALNGIFLYNTTDITADRNYIKGTGTTITSGINCEIVTDSRITNNRISNCGLNGIYVYSTADRNVIQGNHCYSNGQDGIYIRDADHCKVSDNYCYGNTNEGIFVWGDCHYSQYTNNYLYDNGGYGMLFQSSGTSHTYIQVLGNHAYHNDDSGIAIYEVTYSRISENLCIDNDWDNDSATMAGIYIGSGGTATSYNVIEDNILINTHGTNYQDYGIYSPSASTTNMLYRNNYITAHPTGKLTDVGVLSEHGIMTDTVELTNANIDALRATPIELVAAPGAGYVLEFISAVLILDYGTNGLTETDDNLVIEYDDGSGAAASVTIEMTGFIDQTADTITRAIPVKDPIDAAADIVNKNLVLINTGSGEFADAGASTTTMTVLITYSIRATGL